MFRSRSIKHARLLVRHAEKLMRYRCDVLSETTLAEIRQQIQALENTIKKRDLPAVKKTQSASMRWWLTFSLTPRSRLAGKL